jgi:hypothetical protein
VKSELSFCWLLLGVTFCFGAGSIDDGYTPDQVIDELGKPQGVIELSDKTLYLYPQGDVTFVAGIVSDFDLMQTGEFLAEQERRRIEREEWQADQERRAARRREEGRAIKAEKMQSGAFAGLPAKDRVDFWRSFQTRYPSVDISEQLATALQGYETELAELRNQERVSELETRVAQAEREAAAARLETEKLRKETEALRRSTRYGLRYYTDPVVHPRPYYHRPPTVTIHTNGTTTQSGQNTNRYHFWQQTTQPRGDSTTTPTPGFHLSE